MDHARRAVRRRRVAVLPTLALIFAQPAGAATSDALRAALAYVPPSPAAPDRRTTLEFVNLVEAAALTKKRGADALLAIVGRIGFSAGTRSLGIALQDPGAWREATGFGLEHLDTLLEYGDVPRITHLYTLSADAPPLSALEKVWAERGFRTIDAGGEKRWGRGEPLKMDPARRQPADPFGGLLGFGSFLFASPPPAGEGLRILEAPDPDLIDAALRERARNGAAARADVAAMLAALDREFKGGGLLQAWLFPDMATAFPAPGGIAPYTVLLIADIEYGTAAETAFVLVFADCAVARAAEREIAEGWEKATREVPDLPAPAWRAADVAGPCPLVGKVRTEGAAERRKFGHANYPALLKAFFSMQLPLSPRSP